MVLTGGASLLSGVVELAEDVFNLPARVGVPKEMGGLSERIRNPRYATAIGLLQTAAEYSSQHGTHNTVRQAAEGDSVFYRLKEWLKNNF